MATSAPNLPSLERARAHLAQGRFAEAEEIGQSVLIEAPTNPDALFVLGMAAAQSGRLEVGLARLEAALSADPKHWDALLHLIQLLFDLHCYPEAARLLSAAHVRDADDEIVLRRLAIARDRAGDWEGARQCWQRQLGAQEARCAAHPLAGLGIRVFDPGFAVGRIGELAMQLDLFAKTGVLGWREPMIGVLLAPEDQIVNRSLLDYFRAHVQVVSDPALIERYARLRDEGLAYNPTLARLPNGHVVPEDRAMIAIDRHWEAEGRPPLLWLSERHAARGRQHLARLGLPPDAWFVCLHVRTPGYLREAADSHHRFRNADVDSYLPAVERIVARGGWVVRIGDPSMPPLPPLERVVDYAHSPLGADWMDVFLIAAARFFLGTTSGPWTVAHAFGTPVAMTNQFPFSERPFSGRDLFIAKPYRARGTGNLLPFAEAMGPPFRHQFWADTFERHGIDVVDNSADEIAGLVEEMLDRLDGKLAYDAEDDALQARFNALASSEAYGVGARIGRAFLRDYRDLLPLGSETE